MRVVASVTFLVISGLYFAAIYVLGTLIRDKDALGSVLYIAVALVLLSIMRAVLKAA